MLSFHSSVSIKCSLNFFIVFQLMPTIYTGAFFVSIGCLATAEQLYTALSNHSTHSIRVIPIIHVRFISFVIL